MTLATSSAGNAMKIHMTVKYNRPVWIQTTFGLDCSVNGEWEYCDDGQKGCFIEERKRRPKRGVAREVYSVQTGCKQLQACTILHRVSSMTHNL